MLRYNVIIFSKGSFFDRRNTFFWQQHLFNIFFLPGSESNSPLGVRSSPSIVWYYISMRSKLTRTCNN